MNIAVIGSGYVGLVVGTCLADLGNNIICVDIDKKKVDNLNKGIVPITRPFIGTQIEVDCSYYSLDEVFEMMKKYDEI